jgi:hypothetical protein
MLILGKKKVYFYANDLFNIFAVSLPPAIKLNLKTLTDRRNSQSIHSKNKRLSSACIVQTDFV